VDSVYAGDSSAVLRTPVTLETLNVVRDQVRQVAVDAGMPSARADLFVLAVNEGMMNAILHGGGGGDVTVTVTPHDGLVAVVEDVRGYHFELPRPTRRARALAREADLRSGGHPSRTPWNPARPSRGATVVGLTSPRRPGRSGTVLAP
jgi:anti-sigma regulatory factor (Ser/Thr protein kinase)